MEDKQMIKEEKRRFNKIYTLILVILGLVAVGIVASAKTNSPQAVVPTSAVSTYAAPATAVPASTTVSNTYPTYQDENLSNDNYYTNVDGDEVHDPAYSDEQPDGATAECNDGTYSFSQHRQGTCSHHGGVDEWLY